MDNAIIVPRWPGPEAENCEQCCAATGVARAASKIDAKQADRIMLKLP